MKQRLLLLLLTALSFRVSGSSNREIIERSFVPSAKKRQGEIRLVMQNDRLILQTLLYTKLLKRVIAVIAEKERRLWTEDTPHHAAAERYIAALERARKTLDETADARRDDDRRELLIEFILSPELSLIVISSPSYDEGKDPIAIKGKEEISVLVPERQYVVDDIREICRDSFDLDQAAADRLLQPLFKRVQARAVDSREED